MGLSDWFELKDAENSISHPGRARKLKLQGITRKNVSKRWQDYRLRMLKNSLTAKREALANMEFSDKQLNNERIYAKVAKKTQAIAELEAKINFIETGEYSSEEFINSRAIKLKKYMMENLEYNRDRIYSLNSTAAEQITDEQSTLNSSEEDDMDKALDEETMKFQKQVQEMIEEQRKEEFAKNTKTSENNSLPKKEPGKVITPEEIAQTVNDGFSSAMVNPDINKAEVRSAIESELAKISSKETIDREEIAIAVQEAMKKIKVTGNANNSSNVNSFIKEDGTYSLKREDIDEDFRINRFDRSKLYLDNEDVKEITAIPAIKNTISTPENIPQIKTNYKKSSQASDSKQRDMPLVVEERAAEKPKIAENNSTNRDISTLMQKVNILKEEQKRVKEAAAKARDRRLTAEEQYAAAVSKLSAYADSLEKDCNEINKSITNDERETAKTEAQINEIIATMAAQTIETASDKKRGI